MKSISHLNGNIFWEDVPTELLNRLLNLIFLVTEESDDEKVPYWCQEILICLGDDKTVVSSLSFYILDAVKPK